MLDELSYRLIDQSSHDVSLPRSNWPTADPGRMRAAKTTLSTTSVRLENSPKTSAVTF